MTRDSMTLELPGTVPELLVLTTGLCAQGPSDPPSGPSSQTAPAEELGLQAFPHQRKFPRGTLQQHFCLNNHAPVAGMSV